MNSKFNFYHVIGWTVGRLLLILFAGLIFLTVFLLFKEKHWSLYLVMISSGYILVSMLWGFWRFYPFYKVTEAGLRRRNVLGFGFSYFYKWSELTHYKIMTYTAGGKAGGAEITAVYVYSGWFRVAKIDDKTYRNYEELKSGIEQYMTGKER